MNKKILRTLTAFCAALMLMGGFSVTAFAQTPEQPACSFAKFLSKILILFVTCFRQIIYDFM